MDADCRGSPQATWMCGEAARKPRLVINRGLRAALPPIQRGRLRSPALGSLLSRRNQGSAALHLGALCGSA